MYISRAMERRVKELAKYFPVIMVCGPRQVGKTTMLKEISTQLSDSINYVTLDYPQIRLLAKSDPELFLQQYRPPVIIDEIQYAPELLPYIKIRVDENHDNGKYSIFTFKGSVLSESSVKFRNISTHLQRKYANAYNQPRIADRGFLRFLYANLFGKRYSGFGNHKR